MLFRRRRSDADQEYLIRVERLKSEILQSRTGAGNARLDQLQQEVDGLHGGHPKAGDLLIVQKVEAELCLFKPLTLLYPTSLRLQARLYRFESERQRAWQADLKRLIPNNETINHEADLRQRLRQLTYEINEAAEAYNRLSRQKSSVVRALNCCGIGIIIVCLILEILAISRLPPGPSSFRDWLFTAMPAGALGAAVTAIGAIRDESARREEFLLTLVAQMVVRIMLGVVYALAILAALFSQILPIKVSVEPDAQFALVLVLAIAAGFSDKFFGQTVSHLITKSSSSEDKADKGKAAPDKATGAQS